MSNYDLKNITEIQKETCKNAGVDFEKLELEEFCVIETGILNDKVDLLGYRFKDNKNNSGWVFVSEKSTPGERDLVQVHISHVYENRIDIVQFLGLPRGFAFSSKENSCWVDSTL